MENRDCETIPPRTLLRRELRSPCDDFRHTLRVGIPLGLILALVLPSLFRIFAH